MLIFFTLLSSTTKLKAQVCNCTTAPITLANTTWALGNATNLCIVVNGTLTIPTPTTLSNCVFTINPGGMIQVVGVDKFISNACCFKGSTTLWNTIDIVLGAKADFNNSWVQDAFAGVTGHQNFSANQPTSALRFFNTKFFNNSRGIVTPLIVGSAATGTMGFRMANCEFWGSGTLLGSAFGTASIGIDFYNLKHVDLTSQVGLNRFHDLYTCGAGLTTVLSTVARRCTFTNIDGTATGSFGLRVTNNAIPNSMMGTLSITGLGSAVTSTPTFTNCSIGISGAQCGVKATNNNMTVGMIGIAVSATSNMQNIIDNNRVTNTAMFQNGTTLGYSGMGIDFIMNNPYGANSSISNNHINVLNVGNLGPSDAMWVFNFVPNGNPGLKVQSNWLNITSGNALRGMYNLMLDASDISGNFCHINDNPSLGFAQHGLNFIGGTKNNITCNTIISNSQTGTNINTSLFSPIGISLEGHRDGQINCNTFGNISNAIPTGLHFDMDCTNSIIKGNKFNNTGYGLICGPNNCLLNPAGQIGAGNQWNSTPPTGYFNAKHFGGLAQVLASQFKILPTDPVTFNPPAATITPSLWFVPSATSGSGMIQLCLSSCAQVPPPPAVVNDGGFTNAAFEAAIGNDSTAQFPQTEQWQSEQDVWQYFDDDAVLRYSTPEYLAFYNSRANDPIRNFSEIDEQLKTIMSSYDATLDAYYTNQFSISDQLAILDSTYDYIDSIGDSTGIANWNIEYNNLLDELNTVSLAAQQRVADNYAIKQGLINNIMPIVDALPEEEIFEWNAKTIYKILLTTVALGNTSFTTQQQEDIETVAEQCPLAGGKIVHVARGLWHLFDPISGPFNDAVNCFNQGYLYKQGNNSNSTSHVKNGVSFYPNPANSFLNIAIDGKPTTVHIECIDMLGNVVYSKNYQKDFGNLKLDISSLRIGVYSLSVKLSNGISEQFKFSVIR